MPEAVHPAPGPRSLNGAVRVSELADRQWGVVSRRQLLASGISNAAIGRALRRRALVRLYEGVYAVGHSALSAEARLLAAVLYGGSSAALSHMTAGWWWGMLESEPRQIHVSAAVPRAAVNGLEVHRPRAVERVEHRGIAVTPPARTLRDMARLLSPTALRHAVAEADRLDLVDPYELLNAKGRGRPGSAALKRALELHVPEFRQAASVLEERFLMLVQEHDLAMPEVNARIGRFRVDCLWRTQRVIVELDGHAFHANPAAAERDRQRDLELRAAGYTVLRYTWEQVTQQPWRVIADLRAALDSRT